MVDLCIKHRNLTWFPGVEIARNSVEIMRQEIRSNWDNLRSGWEQEWFSSTIFFFVGFLNVEIPDRKSVHLTKSLNSSKNLNK